MKCGYFLIFLRPSHNVWTEAKNHIEWLHKGFGPIVSRLGTFVVVAVASWLTVKGENDRIDVSRHNRHTIIYGIATVKIYLS